MAYTITSPANYFNHNLPVKQPNRLNVIVTLLAIVLCIIIATLVMVAVMLDISIRKDNHIINSHETTINTAKTSTITTESPATHTTSNRNPSKECEYGYQGSYCDECGVINTPPNVRIVGGVEAEAHSWPSMALIRINITEEFYIPEYDFYYQYEGTFFCGGSLITRNTVLTAAHCIIKKVEFDFMDQTYIFAIRQPITSVYTIYLGVHDVNQLNSSTVQTFNPSKIIINPNYDDLSLLNDIAIIKLFHEVKLNKNIQIACLPPKNETIYPRKSGLEGWAAGWGVLKSSGKMPTRLQNVNLTIYDFMFCYSVDPDSSKNSHSQICSGDLDGQKDTCQGDSGGPLFIQDIIGLNLKYILVGVTSYGEDCAIKNKPGIYTRVSYYMDWITENLN